MSRLSCSFLLVFVGVLAGGEPQARAQAVAGDKIYKQALRSTVEVQVRVNGRTVSWGTGWVVDVANRLIVTNDHVAGKADTVYEMTLGMIYKPRPYIWIRPEARYDWSQFVPVYFDNTKKSQLTLAVDAILLF